MKKFKLNSDNLKDVTIDKANGVISNISLMTVGEAKGHGIHIDTKTLSLLFGLGQDKNVKSFLNHSDNHTPADAIGFFFGHYIDQATKSLRASFKALPAFMSQEKEFNTLFDLSELAPDSFGVSMVLNGGVETMEDGLEYMDAQTMDMIGRYSDGNDNNSFVSPLEVSRSNTVIAIIARIMDSYPSLTLTEVKNMPLSLLWQFYRLSIQKDNPEYIGGQPSDLIKTWGLSELRRLRQAESAS